MSQTVFYCPDCEAAKHRRYLNEGENMLFFCPACGRGYTSGDLRAAYESEVADLDERIAGLMSDAAWMRDHLISKLPVCAASSGSSF